MLNAILAIGALVFLVLACGTAAVLAALYYFTPKDDYKHTL